MNQRARGRLNQSLRILPIVDLFDDSPVFGELLAFHSVQFDVDARVALKGSFRSNENQVVLPE
jgi:hypothetical protein